MQYFKNVIELKETILFETIATFYMVIGTALIAGSIGIALGMSLVLFQDGGLLENKRLYRILDSLLSFFRSIPFIILLTLIAPITRFIAGTTIGNTAAIVPLVFGTVPFYTRQVQNALLEVDNGLIEAAKSMGLKTKDIIFRIYIREARTTIIRASAVTLISLVGLSAMAGAVGAGGIGKLAIQGYNRFQPDLTQVSTLIILIIVYLIQFSSDYIVKKLSH